MTDDGRKLGAFLEWLQDRGIVLARRPGARDATGKVALLMPGTRLVPADTSTQQLLADYFEIDLQEEERCALIETMTVQAQTVTEELVRVTISRLSGPQRATVRWFAPTFGDRTGRKPTSKQRSVLYGWGIIDDVFITGNLTTLGHAVFAALPASTSP
jgi:hypothetical protein